MTGDKRGRTNSNSSINPVPKRTNGVIGTGTPLLLDENLTRELALAEIKLQKAYQDWQKAKRDREKVIAKIVSSVRGIDPDLLLLTTSEGGTISEGDY